MMRPKPFGFSVPLFLALFSDGQMMSSPSQPHLAPPRKEGSDLPFPLSDPLLFLSSSSSDAGARYPSHCSRVLKLSLAK